MDRDQARDLASRREEAARLTREYLAHLVRTSLDLQTALRNALCEVEELRAEIQRLRAAGGCLRDGSKVVSVDDQVATALRKLLAPGKTRRGPSAEWARLLAQSCAVKSPSAVGRALRRLSAGRRPGLSVVQLPRGESRGWAVTRAAEEGDA